MSGDLVQRLRDRAYSSRAGDPLCAEAADEIARMRLTDAEREAVSVAMHRCDGPEFKTLRGLLERTK